MDIALKTRASRSVSPAVIPVSGRDSPRGLWAASAWSLIAVMLVSSLGSGALSARAQSPTGVERAPSAAAAPGPPSNTSGDPAPRAAIERRWAAAMPALIAAHQGQVAVVIEDLKTGARFEHRGDEPLPTASLIKLPIMVTAYEQARLGHVSLDQIVTYHADDKVPGSGILAQHFSPGATFSLRDAIRLMIAYSDNIATNLVLKAIELPTTNRLMEQWNYPQTKVHAFVFRGETTLDRARSQKFGLGSTTANEMIRLLGTIHRRTLVTPEACEAMLAHLAACDDKARLDRQLPKGAKVWLKTGSVSAARTVAGIVETPQGPFAICVLTAENVDKRWSDDNAAELLSAALAQAAYRGLVPEGTTGSPNAANRSSRSPTATAALEPGATGDLVEDLQRTLNRRVTPAPELSVDGDYGPATTAAVKAFQSQEGLTATGVMSSETWAKLGPLVTKEAVEPIPLPPLRTAADELSGPPFVTCKAWLVGDPTTGLITGGDRLDEPLDVASTTKIMTAYVVARLIEDDVTRLDEDVTFSVEADETPGSTAGVRAGETIRVRDLVLGLMLPSGNDASEALAEHFGTLLPVDATRPEATPRERFVAEMNAVARQLQLTRTRYINPHGLTHRDHKSTVRDQFLLARAALAMPRFREWVNTRQHRCLVTGPTGYQRECVWNNTNKLLDRLGYAGVKTGTTDAAGACLVSLAARGDREAVCVVLGSQSSDARYVDTRNLFRWHWQQRDGLGATVSP